MTAQTFMHIWGSRDTRKTHQTPHMKKSSLHTLNFDTTVQRVHEIKGEEILLPAGKHDHLLRRQMSRIKIFPVSQGWGQVTYRFPDIRLSIVLGRMHTVADSLRPLIPGGGIYEQKQHSGSS